MPTEERIAIESLLNIPDKDGNDVPFKLNPAQSALDDWITGRDVVPKARQLGISTYFLARPLIKCLGKRNRRAVVIAHKADSTQKLFSRVHYMLNNINGPPAVMKYSNKNEITFPKTDSTFYVATAQSKDSGVGDTITDLHCSEVARWPDPEGLMGELLQCVPTSGSVSIESTGKGVGNYYHRLCMQCAQGESYYKLHFLNWLWDPSYMIPLTEEQKDYFLNNLDASLEEPQLLERGVSLEQLVWRRQKITGPDFMYDLDLFKEQYPLTLDECFQSRAHSYFNRVNFVPTSDWELDPEDSRLYVLKGHPKENVEYTMGADASGGVGADNAVIEIVRNDTFEQVGEWASNVTEPDIFGQHIATIGRRFNKAKVNVEKNNHGLLTLSTLRGCYPPERICRNAKVTKGQRTESGSLAEFGIITTSASKAFMIGNLRRTLAEGAPFHSPMLKGELDSFREHPDGKLSAEGKCTDDRVMALALTTFGSAYENQASGPTIMWA